ncbi:putative rhamnogalacturonate lyase C [Fulvia fulva]|uniref:Rhamnogalacturonate lyase C n=1 Tax=Passalora fulva TaxID=5499 RepID=A0A9Q8PDG9_PASFU|nr:putative rhamnogalacturonate lyase C [Fulvia fulva]KAK4619785.1 putative rhamnogalacturonate lyase C [Fulvia fulva]KAK4620813.1 putative rhamnogalacturonate lyase C [Fulvia fulva]UJO20449.1 putative rhamnogalacturonate lyase C [Fulvia fulva]WPV17563.1 putative rhamnogalacturonate lyase C [Fulvia fulva]WPV32312.1 putative rhamnogalacturonate lyase C [Fulvia fulva]
MFDVNVTVVVTVNQVADQIDRRKVHSRKGNSQASERTFPVRASGRGGSQRGYASTTLDFGNGRKIRGIANGPGQTISFGLGTFASHLFTGLFGFLATSMISLFPPSKGPYEIPPWWLQLLHPIKLLARILDLIFSLFRLDNTIKKNISIVCISDTHSLTTRNIPHGDILIHAGDLTNSGTPSEIQEQIYWLSSLPHTHKIIIAGNHDTWLDPNSRATLPLEDQDGKLDWTDLIYLQSTSTTLDFSHRTGINKGQIKIFGMPHTPDILGPEHAFQYQRGTDVWTNTIPDDTDIVVTHTPPRYHLDLPGVTAMGDDFLLREVARVKPGLHVFGHIHAGKSDIFGSAKGGQEIVRWDEREEHFEGAVRSGHPFGIFSNVVAMWHLWMLFFSGIVGVVRDWCGWDVESTRMVNASMVYCNTGVIGNEAQVVYL